jgi:hypothetical protein
MTRVINLTPIATEPDLVLVIDDVRHEMSTLTMQSFIDNLKLIEDLGMNPNPVAELEASCKIISRAFPTITDAMIKGWSLQRIQQLVDIARGTTGEIASTEEVDSGNALKANLDPST